MEDANNTITYEDARKQRLVENKRRFEELGLINLSKNLSELTKSEKSKNRHIRPKGSKPTNSYSVEPRRSSRARNTVSYRDHVDVEIPLLRQRSKLNSSWASYLARPAEEVKVASYEERAQAYKYAEKLQSNLQAGNPSFVKSMVRSHVYSCFWLGLPTKFCENHLPKSTVDMVLENKEGQEYEAIFISKRTGLSGGWRAFALDHKLDDGDALVFELTEPTRFKIYIVRASCGDQNDYVPVLEDGGNEAETLKRKKTKKAEKNDSPQLKNSTKSKIKKSSQVLPTRRSLRKR